MADVLECKTKLRELAEELDKRSLELRDTNVALEPIQEQYEEYIRDHEAGLYEEYERTERKLPGAEMRMTLALKEMPASFRGKHRELVSKRDRLKQRLSDIKSQVESWRSLLSAEKTELEALS